jgi:hypothetical protein
MPNHVDRFAAAVSVLCGHGNIKQRLVTAFLDNLEPIEDDELPIAVQQAFIDLRSHMSRVAPMNGEGPIRASVRKMSINEADDCAQMMVDLYAQMLPYADHSEGPLPIQSGDKPVVPPFLVKSN